MASGQSVAEAQASAQGALRVSHEAIGAVVAMTTQSKRFSDYRSVEGSVPGDFARWVRNLRRKSGVYVIRARGFVTGKPRKVLYVGESHSGKLYETLTRHFQSWEGPQEHTSYDRSKVCVSVKITTRGKAIEFQDKAILRLDPRDNTERPAEREARAEEQARQFAEDDSF